MEKFNSFDNPTKSTGCVVRKIAVQVTVFMLFFVLISCEKTDYPFEYEEPEIEVPSEISEVFSSRFRIYSDNSRFLMFDQLSPGLVVEPVNLLEEFQQYVFVQATVGRIGEEMNECGYPLVKITQIQETDLRDGRFHVRINNEGEYILVFDRQRGNGGDYWADITTEGCRGIIPTNLPEEYQEEGLHVQVIFRYTGEHLPSALFFIAEIIEIHEVGAPAQTRITGGWAIDIERAPWQALLSIWDVPGCGGIIIAPNFILTAAHCLRVGSHEFSPNDLRVHAGITCKSEINNSNTFEVYRIIRHPREPFVEWPGIDVALLQLTRPIPFDDTRHPVNYLASTNSIFFNVENLVTTSGWGWMEPGPGGSMAECLQAVDLTIISNQQFAGAPANIVIARGDGSVRQGGCYGDSGGPLTIRTASNEPILIGITRSIQIANCVGTNNTNPTSFERVDQLVPWINGYVRPVIPTISGPTSFCTGSIGTFALGNVPTGAHIVWFYHSPSLQRVSSVGNTATFRATTIDDGSIRGWVEARVNGIPTARHNVFIEGVPSTDFIDIGVGFSNDPFSRNLCRDFTHTIIAQSHSNMNTSFTDFRWYFDSWTPYVIRTYTSPHGIANAYVDIRLPQHATMQMVAVAPLNRCSPPPDPLGGMPTFPNIGVMFHAVNCFGRDLPLTVQHPNPVSSVLPIQIVPHPQLTLARNMRNAFGFQYNVRLYDREGNVVRQLTTEREQFQLDVSDLPDGYYYLHILDEAIDAPIVQQIIVRNRRL